MTRTPRILLTGFTAFSSVAVNPTERLMRRIGDGSREFSGLSIRTAVLETAYDRCVQQMDAAVDAFRPDAVITFGVHTRAKAIQLERFALNIDDAEVPDNADEIRLGMVIHPDGPAAYLSTLPLDRIYRNLKKAGFPVRFSNHAGAYVCNHIFYHICHRFSTAARPVPAGFIHVPQIAESELFAGMDMEKIMAAVRVIVRTVGDVPGEAYRA